MSDEIAKLVQLIGNANIEDLTPVYEALGQKSFERRLKSGGLLPLRIFPHALAVAGSYAALELIIEVTAGPRDGDLASIQVTNEPRIGDRSIGYVLCKRSETDHGHVNSWHIPGTVMRMNDTPGSMYARLSEELKYKFFLGKKDTLTFPFRGILLHYTPERYASALSVICVVCVNQWFYKKLLLPKGDSKLFRHRAKWKGVIPYQEALLRKLPSLDRPFFITLPGHTLADHT